MAFYRCLFCILLPFWGALQSQAQSAATLDSVSVAPRSLVGGNTASGLVILTGPASTPTTVSLKVSLLPPASGLAPATVPWAVMIRPGEDRAAFQVTTSVVSTSVEVQIGAADRGVTKTANLIVFASSDPTVQTISLRDAGVSGGQSSVGTATLTKPTSFAIQIELKSSNPLAACVMSNVTAGCNGQVRVPSDSDKVDFNVKTFPVLSATEVTISALGPGGPSGKLTVNPIGNSIKDLVFLPGSQILGGSPVTGLIEMTDPAPKAGLLAPTISSSHSDLVTLGPCSPSIITEGFSTCRFPINTNVVNDPTDVTITATYAGAPAQRHLTLLPSGALVLDVQPATDPPPFNRGDSFTFTINVSDEHRVPISGAAVNISNDLCSSPTQVTTDNSGRATYSCTIPGTAMVGAHRLSFGPAQKNGYRSSATVDRQVSVRGIGTLMLDVQPVSDPPPFNPGDTFTFALTVSDENQTSIAGATVNVSNDLCGSPTQVTTDGVGHATYSCTIPNGAIVGAHRLSFGPARKNGYSDSGVITRQVFVRSPGTLLLDVQPVSDPPPFNRGDIFTFTLTVSDENHVPVSGASVGVINDLCNSPNAVTTDLNGRATYSCLIPSNAAAGTHSISFGPARKSGSNDSGTVARQVFVRVPGSLTLDVQPTTVPAIQRGQTVTFTSTVLDDHSQPISGAIIRVTSDLCGAFQTIMTDLNGRASYDCTIPNDAAGGTHPFSFGPATKPGYTDSFTISRQIFVVASTLSLDVQPSTVPQVSPGDNVTFTLTVRDDKNNPVNGAGVPISDALCNRSPTLTTNSLGQASYTCTVPTVLIGSAFTISFGPATKTGYTASGSVSRQVFVKPLTLSLDVQPSIVPQVSPGDNVTFTITVRDDKSNPVNGASVPINDGLCSRFPTVTTNSLGQAGYTCTVPTGLIGSTFTLSFGPATKTGYTASGSVSRQVFVKPLTLSLDVQPAFVPQVSPGDSVAFTITVRDDKSNPVNGASVTINDGLCTRFTSVTTTSLGQASYSCTVPTGLIGSTFTLSFGPATKFGYTSSGSTSRQVLVRPLALTLDVQPSSVPTLARGDTVTFTVSVRDDKFNSISGATVDISDGLCGRSTSVTTSFGTASYSCTVPTSVTGTVFTLSFGPARKSGYASSSTVSRQVFIRNLNLSIDVQPQNPVPAKRVGDYLYFAITISDEHGARVSGASVTIRDGLCNPFTSVTTDFLGQASYTCTVPFGAHGTYTSSFGPATKAGYNSSGAQSRQIFVQ